jgi:hypothetical protein
MLVGLFPAGTRHMLQHQLALQCTEFRNCYDRHPDYRRRTAKTQTKASCLTRITRGGARVHVRVTQAKLNLMSVIKV